MQTDQSTTNLRALVPVPIRPAIPAPGRPPAVLRANVAWALAGNAVYAASQWGMIVVLVKLGTPEMLGQFALGLAVTAPVMIFANLALRQIQATDARGRYSFGDYLGLRLATTALALFVISGLALATCRTGETALVVILLGVAKGTESISDVFHGLFQKSERMDRIAQSLMLKGPLSLLTLGAGIVLTGRVAGGVLVLIAGWLAVLVLFDYPIARALAVGRSGGRIVPKWSASTTWPLFVLALPLGIATMLNSLNTSIPRYALEWTVGERALGLFAAISYLKVAGTIAIAALGQAASTRLADFFARGESASYASLLARLSGLGAMLGGFAWLVSLVGGRPLLTVLYRPEYAEHLAAFQILMFAAALEYVGSLLGYGMTAAGLFRIQPVLFALSAALNVALSILLIPGRGLEGAALASVLVAGFQVAASLASVLLALRSVPKGRHP